MNEISPLKEIFDLEFVTRSLLNELKDETAKSHFTAMIMSLFFEIFLDRGEIPTEMNGDLSGFVIIDETCSPFD